MRFFTVRLPREFVSVSAGGYGRPFRLLALHWTGDGSRARSERRKGNGQEAYPEQRRESARRAAQARWAVAKHKNP